MTFTCANATFTNIAAVTCANNATATPANVTVTYDATVTHRLVGTYWIGKNEPVGEVSRNLLDRYEGTTKKGF